MSKLTKMVKPTDFCCLSRKLLDTLKCTATQVPLTILDPNKVRHFNERLNQWDFYNRELEMQRQAEEAKMKANLKAHSKFSINLLPDYSHPLEKKKNKDDEKKQAFYAKFGTSFGVKGRTQAKKGDSSMQKRESSDSKRGSDSRKQLFSPNKRSRSRGNRFNKRRRSSNRSSISHSIKSSGTYEDGDSTLDTYNNRRRGSSGSRGRTGMSKSKKRNSTSKRRNSSAKRSSSTLDVTKKNLLGKTFKYLTTEEYKRISPELFNLLQEKAFPRKECQLKSTSWKEAVLKKMSSTARDSLDLKNPAFAEYLRNQMEGDSLMNKLYSIDFYNQTKNDELLSALSNSQNPYSKMNLYKLKEVLRILQSGGHLTEDQLHFLYDFLKSAAEMDPESFDKVMAFSQNTGLMAPQIVEFLKELMMKTDSNFTLDKLIDMIYTTPTEEILPLQYNFQVQLPKIQRKIKTSPTPATPTTPIKEYPKRYRRPPSEEIPKKRIKGYIFSEKKVIELPKEPERITEVEIITKLGPRPQLKKNYDDFRIKRTPRFRAGHPEGYYEPIPLNALHPKGLNKMSFLFADKPSATITSPKEKPKKVQNDDQTKYKYDAQNMNKNYDQTEVQNEYEKENKNSEQKENTNGDQKEYKNVYQNEIQNEYQKENTNYDQNENKNGYQNEIQNEYHTEGTNYNQKENKNGYQNEIQNDYHKEDKKDNSDRKVSFTSANSNQESQSSTTMIT